MHVFWSKFGITLNNFLYSCSLSAPIMHSLGKYYRLSIYGATFFCCLVSRYIIVEIFSIGIKIKQWKNANSTMREQGIPQVKGLKIE